MEAQNKLLLYSRVDSIARAHQINLINSKFSGGSPQGWYVNTSNHNWVFPFSNGAHYDSTLHPSYSPYPLYQPLPNPFRDDQWYVIEVVLADVVQGSMDARFFVDTVLSAMTNGTYTKSFSPIAMTWGIPDVVALWPSSDFIGTLKSVRIYQDTELSPLKSTKDYIEKGYLDLADGERVGITWQTIDASDLGKRYGSYSSTFAVNLTPKNSRLLENYHVSSAVIDRFDPRQKQKATFYTDSLPAMRGCLTVKDTTINDGHAVMNCELLGDQSTILNDLQGLTIQDLPLDDASHRLTLENVVGSWSPDRHWREGWTYPLTALLTDARSLNSDMVPSYYLRYIFDRVLSTANYSYTLSPKVEEMMNRMVIAPVGKRPTANTDDLASARNANATDHNAVNNIGLDQSQQDSGYPSARNKLTWEDTVEVGQYELFGLQSYIPQYSGPHVVEVSFDMVLSLRNADPPNYDSSRPMHFYDGDSSYVRLGLWDDDSNTLIKELGRYDMPFDEIYFPFNHSENWTASTSVDLTAGKKVSICMDVQNRMRYMFPILPFGEARVFIGMDVTAGEGTFRIGPSTTGFPIGEHMLINAKDWLNFKQSDLISDVKDLFNLSLIPDDQNARLLHLIADSELPRDTEIILTDEIDTSSEISFQYLSQISSSKVKFVYAKRNAKDDYLAQYEDRNHGAEYGEATFSFGTDLFSDESEVRLSLFSPAAITQDGDGRWTAGILSRSTYVDLKLLVQSRYSIATTLPISYYDRDEQEYKVHIAESYTPFTHTDDISGTWTGSPFDISFDTPKQVMTNSTVNLPARNLFNTFYRAQLEELRDGRLYTVYARLSVPLVQKLVTNVGASIFCPQIGSGIWTRLYSVEQWDPTLSDKSLTKLRLLEIKRSAVDPILDYRIPVKGGTFTSVGLDIVDNVSSTSAAGGLSGPSSIFNVTNYLSSNLYLPLSGGSGGPYVFAGPTLNNGSMQVTQAITATTYYSGSTSLNDILSSLSFSGSGSGSGSTPTYITPAQNLYTAGTPSNPTIGTIDNPIFATTTSTVEVVTPQVSTDNATIASNLILSVNSGTDDGYVYYADGGNGTVTNSSRFRYEEGIALQVQNANIQTNRTVTGTSIYGWTVSGDTLRGGVIYSGNTPLNDLLGSGGGGQQTFVQAGLNIITGGTANRPIVSVSGSPTFSALTVTGGILVTSLIASTIQLGHDNLADLLAMAGTAGIVYPQQGANILTGGTALAPIISLVASPSFTTVSASTFVESGATLSDTYLKKKIQFTTVASQFYSLALGDAERMVLASGSTGQTITVPPNGTVAYPVGTQISVTQLSAFQTTFSAGTGVTIRSRGGRLRMSDQYGGVSLSQYAPNSWLLIGNLSF